MRARALPGVEEAGDRSFSRHLRLDGGPGWFELDDTRHGSGGGQAGRLHLRARVAQLGDLAPLVARARRLFDLDADPLAVDSALAAHPPLAPLVARTPGIRVPGAADPHEMLIRAMIGQQITVAAARTALAGLAEALGERVGSLREPQGAEGEPHGPAGEAARAHAEGGILFPTMAAIAEHGAEVLRGPAARIRAITGAAAALADGSLRLTLGDDGPAQRAALLAMAGIGPWTADYVRMRVLGDPDVFLPGDVAARAGAREAGLPAEAAPLDAWAARTAPWRSYLTAHLWRAAPVRQVGRRGALRQAQGPEWALGSERALGAERAAGAERALGTEPAQGPHATNTTNTMTSEGPK